MESEKVYAIWDYWDGIRSGFADFRGVPHYFEAVWNEQDEEYSPTFTLRVVNQTTLDLVLEMRRIFRAWELQFYQGQTPRSTHPALPGQDARFVELDSQIRKLLESFEVTESSVLGSFEVIEGQEPLPPGMYREVRVMWKIPHAPLA
jgi:hypothetical protein